MARVRAETRGREVCGLLVMLELAQIVQRNHGGHGSSDALHLLDSKKAVFRGAHKHLLVLGSPSSTEAKEVK